MLWFGADIVMVLPPAAVDWLKVILLPPAKTSWFETVPVVPAVLPNVLIPAEKAGAPMLMVEPLELKLKIPVADRLDVAGADT